MPRPLSLPKRLLFAAVPLLGAYLVLEALATAVAWSRWWDNAAWFFEDSGRTWHFDPIRGYRLTTTPSRFLRVTDGVVEYVGTARGNALGFPDRDDFRPGRPPGAGPRVAVFGDSFTEAQYLGQNWPDRAEDLARARGRPVEFLNFAVSGGGLANWWSILTRHVAAEGYELDGILFVVFAGDLRRTFSMWEHRGAIHPRFGRTPGWDPSTYPATLAEARGFLREHPGYILSAEEFERAVQGGWPRSVPRRFRPYLLTRLWRLLRAASSPTPNEPAAPADSPTARAERARLVGDIRRFLDARGLPAVVVSLPEREGLLDPDHAPEWPLREAREFARDLGARFLDATPMFAGLSRPQIRALFLPYDGHWNQAGSNRFADFVVDRLGLFHGPPSREAAGRTDPARH